MCKYCKDMKNSDDVLPLELSSCEIGDVMGRGMSVVLGMNCYKHGKTGRYQIFSDFRVDGADLDAVTSINIRYCPMCGRKLTEKSETKEITKQELLDTLCEDYLKIQLKDGEIREARITRVSVDPEDCEIRLRLNFAEE